MSQLRDYVTTIASMYRPNAFHNFEVRLNTVPSLLHLENSKLIVAYMCFVPFSFFSHQQHASHVTMSTHKLLKRVTVSDAEFEDDAQHTHLHKYTYGITSDALTQFTLVFCALIHGKRQMNTVHFLKLLLSSTVLNKFCLISSVFQMLTTRVCPTSSLSTRKQLLHNSTRIRASPNRTLWICLGTC